MVLLVASPEEKLAVALRVMVSEYEPAGRVVETRVPKSMAVVESVEGAEVVAIVMGLAFVGTG